MPLFFTYIVYQFGMIPSETACTVQLLIGFLISFYLRVVFGAPDWGNYPDHETPYYAGYKTMRTAKHGNLVHIWYPISKTTPWNPDSDVAWLTHGHKTVMGLLMMATGWKNPRWGPTWIFWPLYKLILNV